MGKYSGVFKKSLSSAVILLIFELLILPTIEFGDSRDILVELKFYEGLRGKTPHTPRVVTSYSIKYIDTGSEIPVFKTVHFKESDYNLMDMPYWLDAGLQTMKQTVLLKLRLGVLREQLEVIEKELTTTVQRINLFEKVKIPQAQENIRKIRIFLGDQQTAGVVRGKMTKGKLTRKRKAAAVLAMAGAGGQLA